MKNLKKVLSLVLALAMALRLMTAAFATDVKDFGDYDEIDQKEAVDVMTAIGVIDGIPGDKYDPDGTLTREQAAKIATYMLLGSKADTLSAQDTGFTDVPATRWSAPYVSYCASVGIIDGIGNNKFAPEGKLTGYQFAKILLGAIGYGVNDEYTGSAWALNVARDGVQIGLFKGCAVSNDPISRDDAARLAFNALRANLVSYSELFGTYSAYSQGFGNQKLLGTLAENVFSLKPTYKADGYGYTTRAWKQSNKVVTDYYNIDTVIDTITDASTTVGQLLKDYDWQTKDADGDALVIPTIVNGTPRFADTLTALKAQAATTKLLKNGYTVVLVDGDENGEVDKVIVTIEYLAKVTKVNAATASEKRSVNIDVYDTTGKVTQTKVETEDFAKDEYILVIPSSDNTAGFAEPLSMKAAEAVTGSVTAYYKEKMTDGTANADGSVTVDGVKYNYNGIFAYSNAMGDTLAENGYTLGSKASYKFFLDSNGYVIGVKVVDDTISDYAYIIDKGADAFGVENIAKVLLSDGSIKTYNISSKSDDAAYDAGDTDTVYATVGQIWAYSINADGEIVLSALTGDYAQKANTASHNTLNSFTKGYSAMNYLGGSQWAYATDETVFIYLKDGKVVGNYTGKSNAPSVTSNKTISMATKTVDGKDYAQFVVVTADPESAMTTNYVYNLKATYIGYSKDNNDDFAYYWEVVKNGKKTVIASDKSTLPIGLYNYSIDEAAFSGDSANGVEAGLYDLDAMSASNYEKDVTIGVSSNDNVIVSNDNAKQFVIAPETVIVDISDVDDVTSDASFKAGDKVTVTFDEVGGLKIAQVVYITTVAP